MEKKTYIMILAIISLTFVLVGVVLFYSGLIKFDDWFLDGEGSNNDSSINGVTDGANYSSANLVMLNWEASTNWSLSKGYHVVISFVIKNDGNGSAAFASVRLYSTDQGGEKEADYLRTFPTLKAGETYEASFEVEYEVEDTLLDNSITISWAGGFNEYSKVVDL